MRPWLAVVGMLFLILAVGLLISLYIAAQGSPTTSTTDTRLPTFSIAPNATETVPISGSNGSSEQFSLVWSSTAAIRFELQSPAGCSSTCWITSTIVVWPSNTSGSWAGSGPFHYPLQCVLKNVGSSSANVNLHARAVSMSATHPSLVFDLVLGAGAGALFVVGGLAIFLSLFLRANPYGPPPPLAPRSSEDVEELTRNERPLH